MIDSPSSIQQTDLVEQSKNYKVKEVKEGGLEKLKDQSSNR